MPFPAARRGDVKLDVSVDTSPATGRDFLLVALVGIAGILVTA